MIRRQCLDCGQGIGAQLKHASFNLSQLEWFDEEAKDHGERLRRVEWKQAAREREEEQRKKDNAWWQWYREYLKSDSWRSKRERVLQRDSYRCRACEKRRATQAHHLTYERVGHEPLFDLVAICDVCHEAIHTKAPRSN